LIFGKLEVRKDVFFDVLQHEYLVFERLLCFFIHLSMTVKALEFTFLILGVNLCSPLTRAYYGKIVRRMKLLLTY